jgi:hypothetical protein
LKRISPCIDAGVSVGVDDDYDRQQRPLGGGPDMGYDEVAPLTYQKFVNRASVKGGSELVYSIEVNNPDPNADVLSGTLDYELPVDVTYVDGPDCNLPPCTYNSTKMLFNGQGTSLLSKHCR